MGAGALCGEGVVVLALLVLPLPWPRLLTRLPQSGRPCAQFRREEDRSPSRRAALALALDLALDLAWT